MAEHYLILKPIVMSCSVAHLDTANWRASSEATRVLRLLVSSQSHEPAGLLLELTGERIDRRD